LFVEDTTFPTEEMHSMTAQVITLKHLAREFDIDPYKLRRMMRRQYGLSKSRRWRWQEGEKELNRVREWLKKEKSDPGSGCPPVLDVPQHTTSESTTEIDSSSSHTVPSGQRKKQSTSSRKAKSSSG
jgi:hypothetical protein